MLTHMQHAVSQALALSGEPTLCHASQNHTSQRLCFYAHCVPWCLNLKTTDAGRKGYWHCPISQSFLHMSSQIKQLLMFGLRWCSVESTEILGQRVPYYHLFNGLLMLLAVLHAYW